MKALSEIEIKYYENDVVKVRYKAPVTASAFVHYELMNSHYVKLSFHSAKAIGFRIGDFIELPNWGRFEIVEPVKPQYDGAEYTYEPQFEAYYRKWKNKKVRYIPESGSPEAYFTLTASILVHARIILRNLAYLVSKDKSYLFNRNYTSTDKDTIGDNNAVYGKTDFTIFVDSTVDVKKARNISYQNINILDAITQVASTFECEWWVTENVIHFGECKLEQKADVELKSGTNVASISSSPSTSIYFTRLLSFGAARNLPDTYKKDGITDVTKDGVVEQRLMLPTVDELIEYAATSDTAKAVVDKVNKELSDNGFELVGNYLQVKGLSEQQYIEGAVTNDDDYPKNIIEIGKVETYAKEVKNNATADENDTITRTYYRLSGLKLVNEDGVQIGEPEFLDKYILKGKDLSILFQSGSLNGLDFTCKFNPLGKPLYKMNSNGAFVDKDGNETTDKSKYVVNPESQCFEVCANENYGRTLPDPDLCPKVGDTFVLYNWDATMMPGNLIMEASVDLLLDTIEYLKKSMIDPTTYTATMLSDYVFKSKRYFSLGEAVKLNNPAFFTTPRDSRVIGYEIKLDIPWDSPQYIIGEKPSYSKIGDLAQRVSELTYNGKSYSGSGIGGTSVYIVTSNDNTPFSDTNTLSSLRAQKEFLSKTQDDTAQGLITFVKGLISDVLVKLKGGATFGTRGYKFDEKGNVVVDALSSLAFDEALEHGFGITKNSQGKYTLSVTDLTVWGKAVFNSLEIRKLYAVGGNVYLSGASSKLQHVSPVTDADGEVTGWKCYILGDDGTTATQNGWARYDQAKCQTFDIKEGVYENVSNTYYWRLVTDVSTENEAITETYTDADGKEQTRDLYDGKKFGWVVLSKTDCESTTNDAPKAGDTIVLDGHRMFASGDAEGRDQYNDESRTNVMMLETTGTEDGTLPRIVALTGIVDYRHWDGVNQYSNTVFILSPKEVVFVSSSFKFISASGDPITLVNFRGNWAEGTKYGYYDQVSHNNAIWTCIVKKGTTTTDEPSDTSAAWRKEISGGTSYGVTLTVEKRTISSVEDDCLVVTFTKGDTDGVTTTNNVQDIGGYAQLYVDGKIDTSATARLNLGTSEAGELQKGAFPQVFTAGYVTVKWYDKEGGTLLGIGSLTRGADGKDATVYGVQVSSYSEWISSGNKLQGLQFGFTKTTGTTVEKYTDVTKMGCTVKIYGDDTLYDNVSGWINEGNDNFLFSSFPYNNVVGNPTLADKSVISVELYHDYVLLATANYANGKQGADGSAATVYTIETVGNYTNNSGKLVDASTIGVTLTGDLKLYKTVGNEKTEDSKPPQCWRLTVGGGNVDGTRVFDNNAGNNIVTYEYYNEYNIDSNGNSTAPGSATISVYRDSSMSELLASLVVPISLNPGAIVNVDAKLGKIESTTASMKNDMNGMQGTIETIKQGQGQISLKVQDLQNGGVDTSKPHTSSQVDFRALDGNSFYPVMIRFKDDGGVRHTVEINRPLDGTYGSSEDYMTHGNGFSFRLIFSDIANGWGTNEDGQLRIESISQRWTEPTDTPICPKIEQYYPFSFMLVWLRGGSKYDITVDCTDAYISGIWPYMMQVASNPSWVPDAVRLAPDTWTTAQVNAQGGNPYNMLRKDNGGYYADVDNGYLYRFGELAAGNTFAIVGQPRDSKVWFLATWHITNVSGSKVYVDVSTYGLLWQAQNPLGIRMSELGYIKTGASYPKSTWDSQNGFGTSEDVDNTAVHADWAVPRAILVIGKESSATNGVYRDRAVLEAVQSCTEGSSVSFYSNTYFDVSPLYGTDGRTNVKPDLLATGIDIKSHKIVATADNFIVRNNSGTPTFSIDEDGNIVGSGGASFNGPMKATTFTLNSTYFSVKEDGTITAKGGQISFFYFDAEGMASAVEYDSSQNKPWRGIGLSSNNISVSGYTGQRISSVFLGKGLIDSRFAGSDKNYIVHRVGSTSSASTFYNYIKLERFEDGHDSYENDPEYAALGIETQGDFCLAALGGPSLFAGMCFASNTGGSFSADKKHCFYLCEGGTFKMPSDPPDGMLIVVIQKGSSRINFNGNGHRFQSGTYNSLSFTSDSAGQWSLFYYHNEVWYTIYMTR